MQELKLNDFWNENYESIRGTARKYLKRESDVDDYTQDLYIKLAFDKPLVLADLKNPLSYVKRMLINLIKDGLRDRVGLHLRENAFLELDDTLNLPESMETCLPEALSKLPASYAEAVFLSDFLGKKQKDIAKSQEIPYSTLKSRIQTGRKLLRQVFEEYCIIEIDSAGIPCSCMDKPGKKMY